MLSRRVWKSWKYEDECVSRYFFSLGIHASMSYFVTCPKPRSPPQLTTTRYGNFNSCSKFSEFVVSSSCIFTDSSWLASQSTTCSYFTNSCMRKISFVSLPWLPASRREEGGEGEKF